VIKQFKRKSNFIKLSVSTYGEA